MMFLLIVVKSNEDVNGYGDGDGVCYGDEDGDEDGDGDGNGDKKIKPSRLYNLPSPFPPNLSSVLRFSVSYLIFPKAIIVLDKVVISSIPPNPPYCITIIPIITSDKDTLHIISPNTVIAPDKDIPLRPIIVLDKAFALAPNARYRYRTCSITVLSPL